jgi:hypothetical protein
VCWFCLRAAAGARARPHLCGLPSARPASGDHLDLVTADGHRFSGVSTAETDPPRGLLSPDLHRVLALEAEVVGGSPLEPAPGVGFVVHVLPLTGPCPGVVRHARGVEDRDSEVPLVPAGQGTNLKSKRGTPVQTHLRVRAAADVDATTKRLGVVAGLHPVNQDLEHLCELQFCSHPCSYIRGRPNPTSVQRLHLAQQRLDVRVRAQARPLLRRLHSCHAVLPRQTLAVLGVGVRNVRLARGPTLH